MAVYSAQIQMMNDQVEASKKTAATVSEQVDNANLMAASYRNLVKAMRAFENGEGENAATSLAEVEPSLLDADSKAAFESMAQEMNASLFAAYRKAGIAAFDNRKYDNAVRKLELAKAIDGTDYDVLNYLAHSYRMLGDTENADRNFNLIISTYPDSQKAENARQYLSTGGAAGQTDGGDSREDGET